MSKVEDEIKEAERVYVKAIEVPVTLTIGNSQRTQQLLGKDRSTKKPSQWSRDQKEEPSEGQ